MKRLHFRQCTQPCESVFQPLQHTIELFSHPSHFDKKVHCIDRSIISGMLVWVEKRGKRERALFGRAVLKELKIDRMYLVSKDLYLFHDIKMEQLDLSIVYFAVERAQLFTVFVEPLTGETLVTVYGSAPSADRFPLEQHFGTLQPLRIIEFCQTYIVCYLSCIHGYTLTCVTPSARRRSTR